MVGALAVAVALAGSALVDRMRRILPYVNRIGGAVLILVGLYVGYYGYYEVRLFTAAGNPADPVIAAAGRLQGAIAGWVHQHGSWPWILALAVLLLAAALWSWRREKWCYFETDTVPCRSGHGGRRTIASVARVAETSPVNSPIIAMRVLSTAGTHDA